MPHSLHLQAALDAAHAAGDIIRKAYRGNFEVQFKSDSSPVTDVDVAAERAIRKLLASRFPNYGFYGEETGGAGMDAEYLWLVDPIDGTKAFVRGYPVFSVQIALMHRGPANPDTGERNADLVLGVSSAPCWNDGRGELAWAAVGQGAHLDGQRIGISDITTLAKATLSTGNLARLAASPAWANLGALIPRLHRIRGYGDFLHYHFLASGKLDAVVESDVNILDIAALTVIVREAGGVFTDLRGAPIGLETTSVLAAVPSLHAELLKTLAY